MFHADVVDSSRETIFEDRAEILKMGRDLAMRGLLDVLHVEDNMNQASLCRDSLRNLPQGIHYEMTIAPTKRGWEAEIIGGDQRGTSCSKGTVQDLDNETAASEFILRWMQDELQRSTDGAYLVKSKKYPDEFRDLSSEVLRYFVQIMKLIRVVLLTRFFGSLPLPGFSVRIERRHQPDVGFIAMVVDTTNTVLDYRNEEFKSRYIEVGEHEAIIELVKFMNILRVRCEVEDYEKELEKRANGPAKRKYKYTYKSEVRESHRTGRSWAGIITRAPRGRPQVTDVHREYCPTEIDAWRYVRTWIETEMDILENDKYEPVVSAQIWLSRQINKVYQPKIKLPLGLHVEPATGHRRRKQ
ncbi:uncharacterized protein J4E78_008930 [Alternaria triticimaculans]|uniref:uncharacterized protein n=1 Tax=Alternaria triticimaculans TaxID=297637 RepID=UPI0020C1D5EA|nr:uncharacterized protein J4E78_008930 [Alternaria triticimaculans]KAI4647614.1 hypothetical protein J4E78_008930 [Alternaria triticimaculans]